MRWSSTLKSHTAVYFRHTKKHDKKHREEACSPSKLKIKNVTNTIEAPRYVSFPEVVLGADCPKARPGTCATHRYNPKYILAVACL